LTIHATLCFIIKDNKILLLKKSKGLLGQGNGTFQAARYSQMKNLRLVRLERS